MGDEKQTAAQEPAPAAPVQTEIKGTEPAVSGNADKAQATPARDYAAELAAAEKRAAKLEKEFKTLTAKYGEADAVLGKLKSALVGDAPSPSDPVAEANAIKARADAAAAKAAAAIFRVEAQTALLEAGVRKDRVGKALRHLDSAGIEIDIDAGGLRDPAPLIERVNALKNDLPEWFQESKAAAPVVAPPTPGQPKSPTGPTRITAEMATTMDLAELRKVMRRTGSGAA